MGNARPLARLLGTTVVMASAIAWGAAAASGASYCVTPATGCTANYASVQSALNAAALDASGSATVVLGAATYNEDSLSYNAGSVALTLTGQGQGQSILTDSGAGGSGRVFQASPATSATPITLSNLTVQIPAGAAPSWIGVEFNNNAVGVMRNVAVSAPAGLTGPLGVSLDGAGTLDHTTLSMASSTAQAVRAEPAAGQTDTFADSLIAAPTGIDVQGVGTVAVHRSRFSSSGASATGLGTGPGPVSVEDSLFFLTSGARAVYAPGAAPVALRHVTIVGDGSGSGVTLNAASNDVALNLADSVERNLTLSVRIAQGGGHTATLTNDYNDFPGATNGSDSHILLTGGASFAPGPHNIDADPLFAGAPAGDFRLLPGSPALNRDPAPGQAGESLTDLDGHPRFVPGATRDMGAFQHQPPVITSLTSSPAAGQIGVGVTFSGAASDPDPGDALSFVWSFDDGRSAAGATVSHAFATARAHTATLTVTDATGLSASRTLTVGVLGATVAPALSSFSASPKSFAVGGPRTPSSGAVGARAPRGTTFRFAISAPATAAIYFNRLSGGRRAGRFCLPPRPHPRRQDRPCTRHQGMGRLRRVVSARGTYSVPFSGRIAGSAPLSIGRYQATLSAVNAAGGAVPRRLEFKVVAAKAPRATRKRARRGKGRPHPGKRRHR